MNAKKSVAQPLALATFASALLFITGFGTFAALTAEVGNSAPQDVSSGSLILDLTSNGQGFTENVANLAPGDVVNRYVVITNAGTLDGDTLTMAVTPTGASSLIYDGLLSVTTRAITLAISSCTVAWNSATGVCGGTTEVLQSAITLGEFDSEITLVSGAFAPLATENLQISLTLPNQDETTVNGNFPADTIQGKSVDVSYTFRIMQRTASTSNQ